MGKKLLPVHKIDFTGDELAHRWYTVKTGFNFEQSAADNIIAKANKMGFGECFKEVVVPIIETVETVIDKNGKAKKRKKRTKVYGLDNMIWIKMIMNNTTWNIVRQSTGVTGWLNEDGNGRPYALDDFEMQKIKEACGYVQVQRAKVSEFKGKVGQRINIVDGPMTGLAGEIQDINQTKKIVQVVLDNGFKIEAEFYQVEVQ